MHRVPSDQLNKYLSICDANIESCVVDLCFGNRIVTIIAIYRPPQGCKQQFIIELERILNNYRNSSNQILLLGDINLNLLLVDEPSIHDYVSMLYSKSMLSLIDQPTRYPPGMNSTANPSLLDHIWTNYYDVTACGIADYDQTDHMPVFCFLKSISNHCKNARIKIESRPFSDENLVNSQMN